MKIRALAGDDEPLARQQIEFLLRDERDVELIGACGAGEAAIEFIRREHPGLVFLEPRLPDMDGLEVMRTLPQVDSPVTIFTTSDDSHALRAFEAGAVDYLLKPFTSDRFKKAMRRAVDYVMCRTEGAPRPQMRAQVREALSRLLIKDGSKTVVVKTEQIDSIESAGNYVAVNMGRSSHNLRETLSALEMQLDPRRFLRISRSAIVNLVVNPLRNFLFGAPGQGGFDLAALNIQRGRDHGLGSYNDVRSDFGLRRIRSFEQITRDPEVAAMLRLVYGDVNRIDAWVGILAEDHLPGSSVGPTADAVITDQFLRLRDGDRFWYQNDRFDRRELAAIESTTLADILRRNTGVARLQDNIFFAEDLTQP